MHDKPEGQLESVFNDGRQWWQFFLRPENVGWRATAYSFPLNLPPEEVHSLSLSGETRSVPARWSKVEAFEELLLTFRRDGILLQRLETFAGCPPYPPLHELGLHKGFQLYAYLNTGDWRYTIFALRMPTDGELARRMMRANMFASADTLDLALPRLIRLIDESPVPL